MPYKDLEKRRDYAMKLRRRLRGSNKVCIVCGIPLPEGRRTLYKFCSKECRRKKERERYKKVYLACLVGYGGNPPKCACCGETHIEFLELDHIHGGGTKDRKEKNLVGSKLYHWLIKNNFPKGLQVLCANCNRAKWHRKKRFCPVHHPELYE